MVGRRDLIVAAITAALTVGVVSFAQAGKPVMRSTVFEWTSIPVKETKYGARRDVFESPTATLDQLECHVTTLKVGEAAHPPHQHAEEALVIVKEGTVEVTQNGVTRRAGPGSLIFEGSNEHHGMRNVGATPATYYVVKWFPPGTLKQKPTGD